LLAGDWANRFFDLESQIDLNRLQNPQLMLGSLQDFVIIDEIQEVPELFYVLRVLVDRPENKARFTNSPWLFAGGGIMGRLCY